VTIAVDIPGGRSLSIEHLLLDVNGTLTDRGELLPGVEKRLARLRGSCEVRLLSADTFGTLERLAERLEVTAQRVERGEEKRELVRALGSSHCAAIGNGRNDGEMLMDVALGIAVLGPEGTSHAAIVAADVLCPSVQVALDLLLEPEALIATLRQ
jgi:soluble P-type ATPase